MIKKIVFLFTILSFYKKKLFKILIYEIYFSIKHFKTGNFIKFQNNNRKTDTIPCVYYFIHKISQFINKEKITSVIDLGSGFGRLTNCLAISTKATIMGIEDDKEVFDISIKNKKSNVTILNKNIFNVDYKNLETECFIINDLFYNKEDLANLIKKIEFNKIDSAKKYYLIVLNIDENKMCIFNNYKLLKFTSAGKSRYIRFFATK